MAIVATKKKLYKAYVDKTALIKHFGLYYYKRTPFRLMNVCASFQRAMDNMLALIKL